MWGSSLAAAGHTLPQGPCPCGGRWGIGSVPPTPTAPWVLVLAGPSDTQVPVTESARPRLCLPSSPASPLRSPQKHPSQTSSLATLSLKHCLSACPWTRATLPTQHHLHRHLPVFGRRPPAQRGSGPGPPGCSWRWGCGRPWPLGPHTVQR